ncbi:MAG: hypothetical protein GY943_29105, partial [Chloroflexi bacterium]|nr:hypothetical protein [Chloroflexota bacterium]
MNKLFLSSILLGLSWVTAVSFLPESESLIRIEPGQINSPPTPPRHQTKPSLSTSSQLTETVSILVDDFTPQPTMGDSFWAFNRLGGGRGEIKTQPGNTEELIWGATHVTAQINSGTNTSAGVWTSLSHPIQDCTPLNFSAIFPAQ